MGRYLFAFEEGTIPPAVVVATALLIAVFTLGILLRLLFALVF